MPTERRTVTVPVTDDHIKSGVPGDACGCALVLALTEAIPPAAGSHWEALDHAFHRFDDQTGGLLSFVPLSRDLRVFMARFDKGAAVQPFSFRVEVPAC